MIQIAKPCAVIAWRNHAFSKNAAIAGDLTDVALLGETQLGRTAQGTGTTEHTVTLEQMQIETLAVLGHSLPVGTRVEWLDGANLIAAASWHPPHSGPVRAHLIVQLPEPAAPAALTCRITPPGAEDTYRVGATWAGPDLRIEMDAGWVETHHDNSLTESADSIRWKFRRDQTSTIPVSLGLITERQAYGIHQTGSASPAPTWTTDNSTSEDGGVYTFAAVTGTLLEDTAFFTAAEDYELIIDLAPDAGQAGVVEAHIGAGNTRTLSPGRNSLVGAAADAVLRISSDGAYTGDLRVHKISAVTDPGGMPYIQGIYREVGTHSPVLVLPRTFSQQWIHALAHYGYLADRPQIRDADDGWFNAALEIIEAG